MKTFALLGGIGQVEGRTRTDVVDVNLSLHEIFPCHILREQGTEVGSKRLNVASEQIDSSCALRVAFQCSSHTASQQDSQSIDWIGLALPFLIDPLRSKEALFVGVVVVPSLLSRLFKDLLSMLLVVPPTDFFGLLSIGDSPKPFFIRCLFQLLGRFRLSLAALLQALWVSSVIISVSLASAIETLVSRVVCAVVSLPEHEEKPCLSALGTCLPPRPTWQFQSSWHTPIVTPDPLQFMVFSTAHAS